MKQILYYILRCGVRFTLLLSIITLGGSCHKEYAAEPDRRDYSDLSRWQSVSDAPTPDN